MTIETDAIHEAFKEGGSISVEAGAGCGKTTLIAEGYQYLPTQTIFLSFNKAIADELTKRIQGRTCATFHSTALRNLTQRIGRLQVNARKYGKLAEKEGMDNKDGYIVNRIVEFFQLNEEPAYLKPKDWTPAYVREVLTTQEIYELDIPEEKVVQDYFDMASKVMIKEVKRPTALTYSDMLFLLVHYAFHKKWHLRDWDCVVIDEAQDVSPIRLAIVKLLSNRVVQVGDRRQAIYAFAGAMTTAMDSISEAFNCKAYPLSVTWRCSKAVIEEAEEVIGPFLQPRPNVTQGSTARISKDNLLSSHLDHNSMIVCRTNAPIFKLALELMLNGREFNLQSNLPVMLAKKVKGWAAVSRGMVSFKSEVRSYYEKRLENIESKALIARITDERDCVLLIADQVEDPFDVEDKLLSLMYSKNGVTISTGHKAKGLEAENVFIYDPSLCPAPWVDQDENPEAYEQEMNLLYVMITRAKENLFYVDIPKEV